jgi:hypothetical protein
MNRLTASLSAVLFASAIASVSLSAGDASAMTSAELSARGAKEAQAAFVLTELGKQNAGYHDMVSDVDMVMSGADGSDTKRHFRIQVLERPSADDGDRSLLSFDSPADVKGTALLSHARTDSEDEQWLYLPSTKRVKRIALGNRGGAFLGSEFSYEDLTGADTRKYSWSATGTQACGAATCVTLEGLPKDASSSYSKRVVTVELDTLRVKKVAFFDKSGAAQKTLEYDAYTTVSGKYSRATVWTMQNQKTNRRTVLRFSNMRMSTGLTASDLSPAKLDQGR